MGIRIAANESDSVSASRIYAMSWKSGYKGIFTDGLLAGIQLDFWVNAFNGNYETGRFEIAIMDADGKDIGAGGYGFSRDYEDKSWGEVTSIYFLEEAWGKGYSKPLMDFIIERLRLKGCAKVHCWAVRENLRAARFYEKYGFHKTGKEKQIEFRGESTVDTEYALSLE